MLNLNTETVKKKKKKLEKILVNVYLIWVEKDFKRKCKKHLKIL